MRERLDCAVLMIPAHDMWMRSFMQAHGNDLGGIALHPVDLAEPCYGGLGRASAASLRDGALALRRFDVCLLPVTPLTLGWTRLALANALGVLGTPVLGLTRDLRAAGLQDLLGLGMRDFIRDPATSDDLKIRVRQCVSGRPPVLFEAMSEPSHAAEDEAAVQASAAQDEPPMPRGRAATGESFRAAKARVVTEFERRYLRTMLRHHQGNISQAARAAEKNRRAFWQLMRKHEIAAEPYRNTAA